MIKSIKLTLYPVKDIARSKALYTKMLGIEPYADSPYYVGFRIGDQEVGLANGKAMLTYWDVTDIKKTIADCIEAGATLEEDVKDVGGGLKVASIKDVDGNLIGLRQ